MGKLEDILEEFKLGVLKRGGYGFEEAAQQIKDLLKELPSMKMEGVLDLGFPYTHQEEVDWAKAEARNQLRKQLLEELEKL